MTFVVRAKSIFIHPAGAVCQRLGISRVTLWRKMNRERS